MKQWYFNKKLNADSLTAKGLCSLYVHDVKEVVVFPNCLLQEVKFDYNSIKMSPSLLICTLYIHGQATILLNTNIKKNIYLPATNAWTLKYTLGDKLQQHVAATDHSMWTDRATSCSNTVRRHVAATNRSVCTGESLWKSLSPQRNFVAATSRKKSNQTESVRLVAATKFCCSDKHFLKILQYTRSDLSLRRVASPCWCNLSLSVYRP